MKRFLLILVFLGWPTLSMAWPDLDPVDDLIRRSNIRNQIVQLECESLVKQQVIERINSLNGMIERNAKVLDLTILPNGLGPGTCVADVITDHAGRLIANFSWETMNGKEYSAMHIRFPTIIDR